MSVGATVRGKGHAYIYLRKHVENIDKKSEADRFASLFSASFRCFYSTVFFRSIPFFAKLLEVENVIIAVSHLETIQSLVVFFYSFLISRHGLCATL